MTCPPILAIAIASTYALWLFYLAVMNLKRAKDTGTIHKAALYLGYPILFIGLALDMFVNLTVATILLLEMPEELTVTSRLTRHKKAGGWRGDGALWFCEHLLDKFDPSGDHCK